MDLNIGDQNEFEQLQDRRRLQNPDRVEAKVKKNDQNDEPDLHQPPREQPDQAHRVDPVPVVDDPLLEDQGQVRILVLFPDVVEENEVARDLQQVEDGPDHRVRQDVDFFQAEFSSCICVYDILVNINNQQPYKHSIFLHIRNIYALMGNGNRTKGLQ